MGILKIANYYLYTFASFVVVVFTTFVNVRDNNKKLIKIKQVLLPKWLFKIIYLFIFKTEKEKERKI